MDVVKVGELPATDAPERDAIHVPVARVTAAECLYQGQGVNFATPGDTTRVMGSGAPIGIVDPWLKGGVNAGQEFWMWLKPGTVTRLSHHWDSPVFQAANLEDSRQWIERFALMINQSYEELMEAAEYHRVSGDWTYDNTESYKDVEWSSWEEFWEHYTKITGTVVDDLGCPFICSC